MLFKNQTGTPTPEANKGRLLTKTFLSFPVYYFGFTGCCLSGTLATVDQEKILIGSDHLKGSIEEIKGYINREMIRT